MWARDGKAHVPHVTNYSAGKGREGLCAMPWESGLREGRQRTKPTRGIECCCEASCERGWRAVRALGDVAVTVLWVIDSLAGPVTVLWVTY